MKFDKYLRLLVGVIILFLGFIFKSWFGLLGLIPIFFVIIDFCPACYLTKKCNLKKKIN